MKRTRSNRCYDNKSERPQIINPYHLALATPKNHIHIINPVNGRIERRLKTHAPQRVISLLRLNYSRLASMSLDRIQVTDIQDHSFFELKIPMCRRYSFVQLSDTELILQKFEKLQHQRHFTIVIWNFSNDQTIELRGHTKFVRRMILLKHNPSLVVNSHLATASMDGTIRVWNTTTGNLITMFTATDHSIIEDMIELQDGRLAFTTQTGTVYVWDFWPIGLDPKIIQHGYWISYAIYLMQLKTGQLVMYGPNNYGVKLVDINANQIPFHIQTIDKNHFTIRTIVEYNNLVISHSLDNISFYNLQTRQQTEYTVNQINVIKLISNARLVLRSNYGFISIWNLNNFDEPPQTLEIVFEPQKIKELPDGRLLIYSRTRHPPNRQCCVLDLTTSKQLNFTITSNPTMIRTQADRQTCYDHVRMIFKSRLIPDLCDAISEFIVGHRLCNTQKRQKTK